MCTTSKRCLGLRIWHLDFGIPRLVDLFFRRALALVATPRLARVERLLCPVFERLVGELDPAEVAAPLHRTQDRLRTRHAQFRNKPTGTAQFGVVAVLFAQPAVKGA